MHRAATAASGHQSAHTTEMGDKSIERIYVGGLDPSRGLTVEIVASRLCEVKNVEILSINDMNIQQYKEMQSNGKSIYNNSKRAVFDEDGDLVDTRNFFYVEACCRVDAPTSEVVVPPSPSASALDILAKQYNGVKWMGCNLRVESARPHLLKRLEHEREQLRNDNQESMNEESKHDEAEQLLLDEKVIKPRRRLRIRKRFGEEAFHVDTLPHPIDLQYGGGGDDADVEGWNQFSTLHKRMHDKWQSQQKKLVERRKMERRLWASGKKIDPISVTEKNDDLRSLMFLNRGIHIRFNEHEVSTKESVTKDVPPQLDASVASSSALSSSDSEDSSTHAEINITARKAYVWSDEDNDDDDDGEDDGRDEVDIQSFNDVNKVAASEKHDAGKQYVWSDDETEEDDITAKSHDCNIDTTQPQGDKEIMTRKYGKALVGGSEYTRAVAIDEFSGGMDFDSVTNSHDGGSMASSNSEDDDNSERDSVETSDLCLDNDIRSNMDVLSRMFPDEHFEKKPLAASLSPRDDDGQNGKFEGKSASTFGGDGLIMQRYDPTKEADRRFEITRTDDALSDTKHLPEKIHTEVHDEVAKDESVSSKGSGDSTQQYASLPEKNPLGNRSDEQLTIVVDVDGNTSSTKAIYQQDKLEDIFSDSRNGVPAISLTNLFESEEQEHVSHNDHVEGEVYEQDKLENVFKQGSEGTQSGGFTFGFVSQSEAAAVDNSRGSMTPFSFRFAPSLDGSEVNSIQRKSAESSNDRRLDSDSNACKSLSIEKEMEERPRKEQTKRNRFSEQELDKFENLFFSLNEGQGILNNLDGMKQDTGNQELWQKERSILTADWKRKQKAALSRKGKKSRR